MSGLGEGRGLVLRLGDQDLPVDADGTFAFPAELAPGDVYEVTVAADPTCPTKACTVQDGSGTESGDVVVQVTCADPRYRLFTASWGDDAIRVTDDVFALADGAIATPRVIAGPFTGIGDLEGDALAHDAARDELYLVSQTCVRVFSSASTASGAVAPSRVITMEGADLQLAAVELDAGAACSR